MRSTFAGLNTLVRGLYSNQASLDTVSHNITNANREGYSRQKVNLASTAPQTIYGSNGSFQLGTGVDILSVTRSRDIFVDRQMWKETSTLGYGEAQYDILSKIEGVFQEPTETGIQTVLNKFWTAWQNLSTDASNESVRTTVRQRGVEVVDAVKQAYQQLRDMVGDINSVLDIKVNRVNQITSEVASLNRQIATVEVGGLDHANDLRDRRDYLTDELSTLMKVSVHEDKDGNYNISSGNLSLVMGTDSAKLGTAKDTSSPLTAYGVEAYKVISVDNGLEVSFAGGEISALLDARDSDEFGVKGYLDEINKISQFLLQDFNAVHRAGFGLDNTTGINFFGSQARDYSTWTPNVALQETWIGELQKERVNSDLFDPADGLRKIAAKTLATQGNASGDNAVLLGNRLKIDTSSLLGNASLDTYYSGMIGELGVQVQSAQRLVDNQEALVNQIYAWRESTAGVNLDEEMSDMIRFQKGYAAASRVVTTMDEMLDKLINGMGVVGR